jgi:glucose/arabinose dehydrogenase
MANLLHLRFLVRAWLVGILLCAEELSPAATPRAGGADVALRLPMEFPIAGYGLTDAFPNLIFQQPVAIASPPGETNRLFVVERTGRVFVVTNLVNPTKTEFIDLREELAAVYIETGLLGLAFHPGYATNGYFFVFRTMNMSSDGTYYGMHDAITRFEVDRTDPNHASLATQTPVLAEYDADGTHNGGDLQFGPDGYLYIAIGEPGPPPPAVSGPQSLYHLFGTVLRIDVDKRVGNVPPNSLPGVSSNYLIPANNPFVAAQRFNDDAIDRQRLRAEIYAMGFRNPWRLHFDAMNGDLYCGDVGEGLSEEVNLIVPGANYGWPFHEALHRGPKWDERPSSYTNTPPLYSYEHAPGIQDNCVIGGAVYYGNQVPSLRGAYVMGDYVSGRIRALRRDSDNRVRVEYLATLPNLTTFGMDPRNGDILAASLDGVIKRLVYVPPETVELPRTLEETGAFVDVARLVPAPVLIPYAINVPFWSDRAEKTRWFSLPPGNAMTFAARDNWSFPNGTVWIKHFDLEMTNGMPSSKRRIETRFLVKNNDGIYGLSYRWNDAQTSAELVPDSGLEEEFAVRQGTMRSQVWVYPSRADCQRCHTAAAGYALGFNTAQLNRAGIGSSSNQIAMLRAAGYLAGGEPDEIDYPRLIASSNTAWPLEHRFRSYVQANCAQCHFAGSPTGARWDARFHIPLSEAQIIDAPTAFPWASRIIAPGVPEDSALWWRISAHSLRMPPLASKLLDTDAISLVESYIRRLPPAPWTYRDVGSATLFGASSIVDGVYNVSGAGTNIGGTSDQFHFLFQPLGTNIYLAGRPANSSASGKSGLMWRDSASGGSPYAMLGFAQGTWTFQSRATEGAETIYSEAIPAPANAWVRLFRRGAVVIGEISTDETHWARAGAAEVSFPSNSFAGLAVASMRRGELKTSRFESVRTASVALQLPAPPYVAGQVLRLSGSGRISGRSVQTVEYWNGETRIGAVTREPFVFAWQIPAAGTHRLRARVYDDRGVPYESAEAAIEAAPPTAHATLARKDAVTHGNWRNRYGRDGFLMPNGMTSLMLPMHAEVLNAATNSFSSTLSERALLEPTGPLRLPSAWTSTSNLTVIVSRDDGELHSVSLYFVDWDTPNQRVLDIEIINPETGELLQKQRLRRFSGGRYVTFTGRGPLLFLISRVAGPDVLLSGVFIDPAAANLPKVRLLAKPRNPEVATDVRLSARVQSGRAPTRSVEFRANEIVIARHTNTPFSVLWQPPAAGDYLVVARVTDALGNTVDSAPVLLHARSAPAAAEFTGSDSQTRVAWIGKYGTEGYVLPGYQTNLSAVANLVVSNAGLHVFDYNVAVTNGLELPGSVYRWLAAWTQYPRLRLDIDLRDSLSHTVTLFFAEPTPARSQTILAIDAVTGRVLDRQLLATFNSSVYLSWKIRGQVIFEITADLAPPALLSGVFFDSSAGGSP